MHGLARWFWLNYENASDAEVGEAVGKLHLAANGAALAEPFKGSIDGLALGDAAVVDLEDKGEPGARGMLMMTVIRCPLEKVEEQFIALDQKAIHPSYDKYSRAFTTDVDKYLERAEPFLGWSNEYTVSLLGSSYDARVDGGARFVPAQEGAPGRLFLARAFLKEPAHFNNEDDFFTQDYQVHVFYERAPNEVVHVFAKWVDMQFAGFGIEGDLLFNGTLDNLVKGDEEVEERCKS